MWNELYVSKDPLPLKSRSPSGEPIKINNLFKNADKCLTRIGPGLTKMVRT